MNHTHKSSLYLANQYTAAELKEKLSFWESAMKEKSIPYAASMVRDLSAALKHKIPSHGFIILKDTQAEESRKYSKLPSSTTNVESFIETFRTNYNIQHSIYIDTALATSLDEHGFAYHFHKGLNYIDEGQAEYLIPYLRGMISSLRRKSEVKKMNNFIEYFISSYGPDFREKWINNTQTALFCNEELSARGYNLC